MANLIRTAKPGSKWTRNDLDSYNIRISQVEPLAFFGLPALPDPVVDPELLVHLHADEMQQDCNAELINLLDMVMLSSTGESAVVDFAVKLFEFTGYVSRNRLARTRRDSMLFICSEWRHAQTDVCLLDRTHHDILLLVQVDKRFEGKEPVDAPAQLVAAAMAAFTENNASRQGMGLPPLDAKIMPGIIMDGTAPTFFKVPITEELMTHIAHGTYPPTPTVVTYCLPPIPCPARCRRDRMKPLDNRREIFKCYEAFKSIVGI